VCCLLFYFFNFLYFSQAIQKKQKDVCLFSCLCSSFFFFFLETRILFRNQIYFLFFLPPKMFTKTVILGFFYIQVRFFVLFGEVGVVFGEIFLYIFPSKLHFQTDSGTPFFFLKKNLPSLFCVCFSSSFFSACFCSKLLL
jgi:hypothetical protein